VSERERERERAYTAHREAFIASICTELNTSTASTGFSNIWTKINGLGLTEKNGKERLFLSFAVNLKNVRKKSA